MDVAKEIKTKFGEKVKLALRSPKRLYCLVDKEDLPSVARYLFDGLKARFCTASAVDTRGGIEILYHFFFDQLSLMVSLRTLLSKPSPQIESLAPFLKGAEWIEREMADLFGIKFAGHPDPRRLILSDDWPEGEYPYLRSAD
jgi:NADH-quinone oxidoreductase subunit C